MKKRHFPSSIESKLSQDERELSAIGAFFGFDWLEKDLDTPVHRLWSDLSTIASNELYIYDQSIRALKVLPKPWVRERCSHIQGEKQSRAIAGVLHELIVAGMFSAGGHTVKLPSKKQPVYDIEIVGKNEHISRISCKYVGAKTSEVRFHEVIEDVTKQLVKKMLPAFPLNMMLHIESRNYEAVAASVVRAFDEAYRKHRGAQAPLMFGLTDEPKYLFTLTRLGEYQGLRFSSISPSYSLIACYPIHPNEQRKFEECVEKAAEDFQKVPAQNSSNLISVLVNVSIDLKRAREWIELQFASGNLSSIDGIFVLRMQPIQEKIAEDSCTNIVCTEFLFIGNHPDEDYATFVTKRFGKPLTMVVPLGAVSESETDTKMCFNGQEFDLRGNYVHFGGEHFIEGKNDVIMSFPNLPNIAVAFDIDPMNNGNLVRITPIDKNRSYFLLI